MEKITVIIPVYNTEKYLSECIESVLAQTYTNLKIMLIDDGSTDHSPAICDKYASKDSRIEVIHKENTGVSDCRNLGIDKADTELIAFVDSDDWIDKEYFSVLAESIESTRAGVSVVGYYKIYEDGKQKRIGLCEKQKLISNTDALDNACNSQCPWVGYVWGKLYKKSNIMMWGIQFDTNIKLCEDSLFNYQYLDRSGRVCINADTLYKYRIYNESSTRLANIDSKVYLSKMDAFTQASQIAEKYKHSKFYFNVNNVLLRTEINFISSVYKNKDFAADIAELTANMKHDYKRIGAWNLPMKTVIRYKQLLLKLFFAK